MRLAMMLEPQDGLPSTDLEVVDLVAEALAVRI